MLSFLSERLRYNKYHLFAFGFISMLAHPTFWGWWTYIYPNPYESIPLRAVGVLSCILLLFLTFKEDKYKNFLKFYWLIVIVYNLPFFFTVNLIKNELIDVWLMEEMVMIFVVLLFIPNIYLALIALFIGAGSAVVFCIITNTPQIYPLDLLGSHSIQYSLALVAGYIFNYSNIMGVKAIERQKVLEALGGSIAHEMRNPLGSIHQSAYILMEKFKQIPRSRKISRITVPEKEIIEIQDLLEIIDRSAICGNMVIDMILSSIQDKEVDKSKFKIYRVSDVVNTSIKEFAFGSSREREKVSVNIEHDFYFKGDKNIFVFVIFNLLKNALYYIETYSDSRITISTKKEDFEDKEFNYLYFKDTGAGIPEDKLESIFKSFMTSGKAEGTGLGLPFCRSVMTSFDGKITCNSQLNKYTEFVISLPILSEEDEKKKEVVRSEEKKVNIKKLLKERYGNRTILLADDQLVNRIIHASRLEKLGFKVLTAEHGKNVLEILNSRGNEIDIIFMDLQMPEIDGYKTTELIQLGHRNKEGKKFVNFNNYKNILIVAFTGNDGITMSKIKDYNMHGHLGKSWSNDDLLNVLDKTIGY